MIKLDTIIELSREYGSNPDYVLAGGGNTSVKGDGMLYVKASGFRLGNITEAGFVGMDLEALTEITKKTYSADEKTAEAEVLADMMAARLPGMTARPSVEALLHALFPQKYVVHLHPAVVNGLTCGAEGKAILDRLFPGRALWMDEIKPGYTLAMAAKAAMDGFKAQTGKDLDLLVMQNHGVFFAGACENCVRALIAEFMGALEGMCSVKADLAEGEYNAALAAKIACVVTARAADNGSSVFFAPKALEAFVEGSKGLCAFTPDHIVYCGHAYALCEKAEDDEAQLSAVEAAVHSFKAEFGVSPKVVVVRGVGAFACGKTHKDAETAKALFCDALKIYAAAQNFGGHKFMADEMISFIRNWEVESYRKSVSAGTSGQRRLEGKAVIITGAAQGFGAGLANGVCNAGGNVIIADINLEGANKFASELCEKYGPDAAYAVGCNVMDETSVENLCVATILKFGRLDVFVSNAGIVRSGSLEEMQYDAFDLVTKINYNAFFLCTKYASRYMKLMTRFNPGMHCDIIQINSKSGLSGSNKNFAYAGSKFGGIGLVQSFAMELASYHIKVNAICPGNFLDGPLWMDPDRGLFVQYLRAGKVPGAKTVADVRAFYEAKVPLGRGCEVKDVERALLYVIEQEYETGQALPVTGGQEMLK